MQKTIIFLGIVFMFVSCNRISPIHSLDEIEPALRKHVGNPTRIDTSLKTKLQRYNIVFYRFDDVQEVTFEQLVDFLNKTYKAKPIYDSGNRFRSAYFIPLQDGSGAYKVLLDEWIGSLDGKRHLGFSIVDIEDEIIPPLRVSQTNTSPQ
ncbi:hypothetical protein [Parabacteroides distasonis]|uniref:hypothetical protein n=1 Tax=Parabacteroides distasonis TaxID=823 RepID=UPI00189DD1DE|nr:hypothetical protein [Parabacteroides distasonis]MDB9154427.1 hypothetical protein [Parabacteroides distasonis]MDB9158990.1 hypothetical protein [Parabacteroides distasonis]MDB9167723.1 hypothetical protein [Parabacteroides distasonis]MDB9172282.1 hypothetical protein [Parabacteroides distasonis]MDB9197217.1 hypothetical protein [Parabacteroides distasonis]